MFSRRNFDTISTSIIVLALGLILTLGKVHGFSISMWHDFIDGSPQTENLVGRAQPHRSDDYFAELPLAFSQYLQKPGFPAKNASIYDGENMVANAAKVPVADWSVIFKPTTWGFFFGPDYGMAWNWWFLALGLFLSQYLWFVQLSGGRKTVALVGSLWLMVSAFYQYWSYHYLEVAVGFFLSLFAIDRLLCEGQAPKVRRWFGVLLVWAGTLYAINLYPPFQVPLGWIFLVVFGAKYLPQLLRLPSRERAHVWRLLAVSGGVAVFLIGLYFWQNREILEIMAGTEYPGRRSILGGGAVLRDVFFHNFLPGYNRQVWDHFGICERASFYLLTPFFLPLFLAHAKAWQRRGILLDLGLLALIVAMFFYQTQGWPHQLARLTLADRTMESRIFVGIGVIETILLVRWLSLEASVKKGILSACLAAGFFGWLGWGISKTQAVPPLTTLHLAGALGAGVIILFVGSIWPRWKVAATLLLVAAIAPRTVNFNPVTHGGYNYIRGNPLSEEVLKLAQTADPQRGRWIVYNNFVLSNLPRALGLAAVSGTQSYPSTSFWKQWDPESKVAHAWNRFGHVYANIIPETDRIGVRSPFPNQVVIEIHPDHPLLQQLGVDFILMEGDLAPFQTSKDFEMAYINSHGRAIFRRKMGH